MPEKNVGIPNPKGNVEFTPVEVGAIVEVFGKPLDVILESVGKDVASVCVREEECGLRGICREMMDSKTAVEISCATDVCSDFSNITELTDRTFELYKRADDVLEVAHARSSQMMSKAYAEGDAIMAEAQRKKDEIIETVHAQASAESDRVIAEARLVFWDEAIEDEKPADENDDDPLLDELDADAKNEDPEVVTDAPEIIREDDGRGLLEPGVGFFEHVIYDDEDDEDNAFRGTLLHEDDEGDDEEDGEGGGGSLVPREPTPVAPSSGAEVEEPREQDITTSALPTRL